MLQVEVVQIDAQVFIFKQEEAGEDLGEHVSMSSAELVCNFLKYSEVGVAGCLDEGVQEDYHFVELKGVICHDLTELLETIFEEVELGHLGVLVEKLVGNDAKS
jgi:hypothetical protein